MKKFTFIGLALSFLGISGFADIPDRSSLPPINIGNAVESALKEHPQASIARENVDVARDEAKIARAGLMPSASVNYTVSTNENPILLGFGLANTQMMTGVFDQPLVNMQAFHAYGASKRRLEAAAAIAENDLLKIAGRAVGSYIDVLILRISLEIQREHYGYLQKLIDDMTGGDLKGKVSDADVTLVQARLGTVISDKHISIQNEEVAEINFFRDTRLQASSYFLIKPKLLPVPETSEAAIHVAVENNPNLKANVEKILAAEKDLKSAKSAYLPTLDAVGQGYDFGRPRGDFNSYYNKGGMAGLSLNLTLFDAKRGATLAEDKIKKKIAEDTYRDQYNNLVASISSLYVQQKERLIRLRALCTGLSLQRESVKTMRGEVPQIVTVQSLIIQKDAMIKNAIALMHEFLGEVMDNYNVLVQLGTLRENLPEPTVNAAPLEEQKIKGEEIYDKVLLKRCVDRDLIGMPSVP